MRVTESMLAQIAGINVANEIDLETTPRELAAPKAPDPVTAEQLQSILASISSDVPRGNGAIDPNACTDYWLGVIWAVEVFLFGPLLTALCVLPLSEIPQSVVACAQGGNKLPLGPN